MIALAAAGVSVLFAGLVFTPERTYGVETDSARVEKEDENRPRNADRPVSAPAPVAPASLPSTTLPPQAPLDAPTGAAGSSQVVLPPSAGDAGLVGQAGGSDRNQITFMLGLGLATFGIGSLLASRVRAR